MKTVKIEIPKGFEVDKFDLKTGELSFKEKPKNVMDRIKTIEDVLKDNGMTQEEFDKSLYGLVEDEIAYRLAKLICKSLNEGWTPDWSNVNEFKYVPWFKMGGSSGFRFNDFVRWTTRSDVGSRLCFKSRELAEYAGKQFTSVYQDFFIIK